MSRTKNRTGELVTKRTAADEQSAQAFDSAGAKILKSSVADEASGSFLEYAYSVITSRALPDARDGLKPVHRRILFGMEKMGLQPDHAYVKCGRVSGEVMGKYHPHGDSAIYEALVRMGQDFSLNTPLVDPNGNFGSPNDGPAAARYTECRLSQIAMGLVGELDEDTVDFIPNYDGSLMQPSVLPAAFPNLLVNGGSGIAVGMATKMIPHNLNEAIAASRMVLANRQVTLDEVMKVLPAPDLPTGGLLLGMDQVRAAYETGRGTVRMRAKVEVEPIEGSRGRVALIATELPYEIGTEKIIEKIKEETARKRLQGISDVKDLSDRRHGTRLVIELKVGVNPQALLAELYRLTPLETSFGINNLALVDGQPKTLGLLELLSVFIDHRLDCVRRRTQFRLSKAEARAHIIEGLLIALDNIDEVVRTIKASPDTSTARANLISKFALSDIQAGHILDMPLRRLVGLEVTALRDELAALLATIAELQKILNDPQVLADLVDGELAAFAAAHGAPRKTALIDGDLKEVLAASAPAAPVEVPDNPCRVVLSATGLLARTAAHGEETQVARATSGRAKDDQVTHTVDTTTRGQVLVLTKSGRAVKVDVIGLPVLPAGAVSLKTGAAAKDVAHLGPTDAVVGIAPLTGKGAGVAVGTTDGVVKIVAPDWPARSDDFDVITLKDGATVVSAAWVPEGDVNLVFVTSDAQVLHFPASTVRPQGRSGGGVAGVKLSDGATVIAFSVASPADAAQVQVVTFTGISAKVTPLALYPPKGRGTGGVRAHRFLKGEDHLAVAWVGASPVGATTTGDPVDLPAVDTRRDGSGSVLSALGLVGGRLTT